MAAEDEVAQASPADTDDPFADVPEDQLRDYVQSADEEKLSALIDRSPRVKEMVEDEQSEEELRQEVEGWLRRSLDADEEWLYHPDRKAEEVERKQESLRRRPESESYTAEGSEDDISGAATNFVEHIRNIRRDVIRDLADKGSPVSAAYASDVLEGFDREEETVAVNHAIEQLKEQGRYFDALDLAGEVEREDSDYFAGISLEEGNRVEDLVSEAVDAARQDDDYLTAAEIVAYTREHGRGPDPDASVDRSGEYAEFTEEEARRAVEQAIDEGRYAEAAVISDRFYRYIRDENLQADALVEEAVEKCAENNDYQGIRQLNRTFGDEYDATADDNPIVAEAYAMEGTEFEEEKEEKEEEGFLDRIFG